MRKKKAISISVVLAIVAAATITALLIAFFSTGPNKQGPLGSAFSPQRDASKPAPKATQQPSPVPPVMRQAIGTTDTTLHHQATPTFEVFKQLLDLSMQKVDASYVTHQAVMRYSDQSQRLSFIYQKTNGLPVQTLEELAQAANSGLRNKKEGADKMARARSLNDPDMMKEASRLQVQANRDIYQTEKCFTIEVSSTTNAPPVTRFQKGIPEWLVYRQTAFVLASNHLTTAPQLVQVAEVAPFSENVFLFADKTGRRIYVTPRSQKVFTKATIAEKPTDHTRMSAQEYEKRQQRIYQQWKDFMQTGIDVDRFTLAGLVDLSKQK